MQASTARSAPHAANIAHAAQGVPVLQDLQENVLVGHMELEYYQIVLLELLELLEDNLELLEKNWEAVAAMSLQTPVVGVSDSPRSVGP